MILWPIYTWYIPYFKNYVLTNQSITYIHYINMHIHAIHIINRKEPHSCKSNECFISHWLWTKVQVWDINWISTGWEVVDPYWNLDKKIFDSFQTLFETNVKARIFQDFTAMSTPQCLFTTFFFQWMCVLCVFIMQLFSWFIDFFFLYQVW